MHLKLAADGLAEGLGLLSGMVPTPLVVTTFGPGYGRCCVAATRLGVFDALGEGEHEAVAVAEACGCHPEGMRVLLRALAGFDLVRMRGGRFRNAPAAHRWLRRDARHSLRDAVLFLGYTHEWTVDLERVVRTGEVQRIHEREHPPEFWEAYLRGLASFARVIGPELVWRSRLPRSSRRLLDVGGGHGLHSAAQCKRLPDLRAEVLDLEPACRVGRQLIEEEGLGDRVTFRAADFREADLGAGWDAILIFNVLHNATEAEATDLIRRAHGALAPGGRLLIWDAQHGGERLDSSAGWNELFFFLISGAQAWPEATLTGWLADAGFTSVRASHLWAAPTVLLHAARA